MKKTLFLFAGIALLSLAVFLFLQLRQNDQKNGFTRNLQHQEFGIIKVLKLSSPAFYFAGQTEDQIYLKDLKNLNAWFAVDYQLNRLKQFSLKFNGTAIGNVNIGVRDSNIYITENQSGKLTLIHNRSGKTSHFKSPGIRTDNTDLISEQSLIGRTTLVEGNSLSRQLTRLNYSTGSINQRFLLPKQVDGYFCTDGLLKYDALHSRLYYMYLYRGAFLCLDTNLNLLYQSKTIDTITNALIELKAVLKDGKLVSMTQAKPPKPVNRGMVLYKDQIYMFSAVKADNESNNDFKNNQIVDVYSMTKGAYQCSFYVPKHNGIKLRDFRIKADFLYAIYGSNMIKYKIGKGGIQN